MFAVSCSEAVRSSLFGAKHKARVTELHRLALRNGSPTNTASWFVAQAIRLITKKKPELRAILSYADSTEGHYGTVYQALNFLYLGKTEKTKKFWKERNGTIRHQKQAWGLVTKADAERLGWCEIHRVAKYRYALIVGPSKKERKFWKGKLIPRRYEYPVKESE